MKIEHFAINVAQPVEMAEWYVKYIGMRITFQQTEAPFMTFLADNSGKIMIEIYRNPTHDVPDYKNMNPLQIHLAFVSNDPKKDKDNLLKAGATLCSDDILKDGSHIIMLRDPWGFAIQLCKRSKSMFLDKEV